MTIDLGVARRLGASAGRKFTEQGIPSRNPFQDSMPELQAAWRDGYFSEVKPVRVEPQQAPES